jgi:hypothetical protein
MGIRTQQATIALRQTLAARGLLPIQGPGAHFRKQQDGTPVPSRLLLPGNALRGDSKLVSTVLELLGQPVGLHVDDGYDIALALESGQAVSDTRIEEFIAPFTRASELIVADGLLFNLLRPLLPSSIIMRPLGQALLANPNVRSGLKESDFYMIETRAYNARRSEFVALYDALRRETGCFMNLDLQRVATPTGAASYQHREGLASLISVEAQVRWLLEGRNAQRIVVEHLDDRAAFARYTKIPVVHLAEVVKG